MPSCWFCEGTEGVFHGAVHDDVGVCVDRLKKRIAAAEADAREARRSRKPPTVFIKALVPSGAPVVQILNENPEEMELWLETAEGKRSIRRLDHGLSVYL